MNLPRMQSLYSVSKASKVGTTVICPTCEQAFVKKHHLRVFCSTHGPQNCKDVYWNAARSPSLSPAISVRSKLDTALQAWGNLSIDIESVDELKELAAQLSSFRGKVVERIRTIKSRKVQGNGTA